MSENTINTGLFGTGSNVPQDIQAIVSAILAGGVLDCKKKMTPTTNGGTKQVIYAQVARQVNGMRKPIMLTLTELSADTPMKTQAEMNSLGLGDVYELISKVSTEEEVCEILNSKLETYLTNFDPNKLSEYKRDYVTPRINNLVDSMKQANFDPEVVQKVKNIASTFEDYKKKQVAAKTENTAVQAEAEGSAV